MQVSIKKVPASSETIQIAALHIKNPLFKQIPSLNKQLTINEL